MSSFGLLVTFVAFAVGTASILIAGRNMSRERRLDKQLDKDLQEHPQATPSDHEPLTAHSPEEIRRLTVELYVSADPEKKREVDKYLQNLKGGSQE